MASPQLKKGHTRIANEILDKIMKANLNGTQFRIATALWRYTYGFQRKEYGMSISFIANLIDADRTQVNRELNSLIERRYINVIGIGVKGARVLRFNKNYDEWDKPIDQPEKLKVPEVSKKPKQLKIPKYDENSTYFKMALYLHEKVSVVAKEAKVDHLIQKANLQRWADDFRKLIEIDGVDKYLAKDVMDWVTQDSFWKTNVLSAKKLREKFSELAIKMKGSKKTKQPVVQTQPNLLDREIELQRWIQEGNDPDAFDYRK